MEPRLVRNNDQAVAIDLDREPTLIVPILSRSYLSYFSVFTLENQYSDEDISKRLCLVSLSRTYDVGGASPFSRTLSA